MFAASLAGDMTRGAKATVAVSLVVIVGVAAAFMVLVTTFLFHFSGGQSRMEPVVNYGALAVVAASILVAIVKPTHWLDQGILGGLERELDDSPHP